MLRDIDESNFDEIVVQKIKANKIVLKRAEYAQRRARVKIHCRLVGVVLLHVKNCYKMYKPLPQRCPFCQAYLCYRKYRTPLHSFGTMKMPRQRRTIKHTIAQAYVYINKYIFTLSSICTATQSLFLLFVCSDEKTSQRYRERFLTETVRITIHLENYQSCLFDSFSAMVRVYTKTRTALLRVCL